MKVVICSSDKEGSEEGDYVVIDGSEAERNGQPYVASEQGAWRGQASYFFKTSLIEIDPQDLITRVQSGDTEALKTLARSSYVAFCNTIGGTAQKKETGSSFREFFDLFVEYTIAISRDNGKAKCLY